MAEAYLRYFAKGKALVYSAGIEAHGLNPYAVKSMEEDGIDISGHTSNRVEAYQHLSFDFVLTVCDHAQERCPIFPSKAKVFHQNFPDPSKATGSDEERMQIFRQVRELIKQYCHGFVIENI